MSRILIGNIKGPQGAQGIQGPQGPVGATGPQGPMPDLVNNAEATEAGVAALDAAMGKTLQDQLTDLNINMLRKKFIGSLSRNHDFDNLQDGCYFINTWAGSGGNNYPQAQGIGFMLQFSDASQITQFIFYTNKSNPSRICTSGVWEVWSEN